MRIRIFCLFLLLLCKQSDAQSITQVKKELAATPDPIGYVKYKLKKKFKIDTITIVSTSSFMGVADSLAYHGLPTKVYGPFKGENILIRILGKAPNTFYRVSHILLDTSLFRPRFADSLATNIISRLKAGTDDFGALAASYSNDRGSSVKGGDLGWFIRGIMLPQMDNEIARRKKGEVFKVWSQAGLHVVKITANPKKDNGFALLLRVLL